MAQTFDIAGITGHKTGTPVFAGLNAMLEDDTWLENTMGDPVERLKVEAAKMHALVTMTSKAIANPYYGTTVACAKIALANRSELPGSSIHGWGPAWEDYPNFILPAANYLRLLSTHFLKICGYGNHAQLALPTTSIISSVNAIQETGGINHFAADITTALLFRVKDIPSGGTDLSMTPLPTRPQSIALNTMFS